MFGALDSSYNTTYYTNTTSTGADAGMLAGIFAILGMFWLVGLAISIFMIIVMWKVFTKAGKKGWYSIIPFLNTYTMCEIAGIKGWLGIVVPFAGIIPIVGGLAVLAFTIYMQYCLAKVFGKDTGFAVGLILLSPVFMAILAFGDAKYLGAGASPAKTNFMASEEAAAGHAPKAAAAKKDEWVDGKEA